MRNIALILGLFLVVSSILSSIFYGFYFWYSFYIIGAFVFFGSLNYKLKSNTVFKYLVNRKFGKFLIVYILGVLVGLFVDVIYGRNVARLWYYPHLNGVWDLIFPVLLYYPFGGLQVYEIFYFVKTILSKFIKSKNLFLISTKTKNIMASFLVLFTILGLIVPIINLKLNGNLHANELMVLIMALTIFSGDVLVYFLNKNSILFDFLQGNKLMIATIIISWLISTILTEVPNTFSWEWIYYNVPFIKTEIFKINILIFTIGWFFLVFVPVRWIDFVRILFQLDKNN